MGMLFRYIYFSLIMALPVTAATNFTVATFNVENYFLSPFETRKKKAEVSKRKSFWHNNDSASGRFGVAGNGT